MKDNKSRKEKNFNIPNTLTIIRFVLTFFLIYLIFGGYSNNEIVLVFIIAALTDFFDGQIARRFDMETQFGKTADPIADRFLIGAVVLALFVKLGAGEESMRSLVYIMSREIISLPAFIFVKKFNVRFKVMTCGKMTMVLQCVTIPYILLGLPYANILIIATCLVGVYSGIVYTKQMIDEKNRAER